MDTFTSRSKSRSTDPVLDASMVRREDHRLVTGKGCFVADVKLDKPLHIEFARSPLASGAIRDIAFEEAANQATVVGVFTGKDVADLGALSVNPVLAPTRTVHYPVLACKNILAVGQPIAAIVAETPADALAAAEYVSVDIEGIEERNADAVASGSDLIFQNQWQQGDPDTAFQQAAHIVDVELRHPRLAPSPMENRAIAIQFDRNAKSAKIWLSTQTPHRARKELAKIRGIEARRLRVIAPDVGGAFGLKASLYPEEVFAVWTAFKLERSVRWNATRSDDLLSASHGRGLATKASLALGPEGKFLALRAEITAPVGCWLTNSSAVPAWNAGRILPGPYNVGSFAVQTSAYATNTAPVGIYRGAGRPEAALLMERLVDEAARKLGADPVTLRRQNLLKPQQLPCKRATGIELDSGDYPAVLDLVAPKAGFAALKSEIQQRRTNGEIVGLGIAYFVEPCGTGWESATVQLNTNKTVTVKAGGSSQGHGRETAYAQIAARELSIDADMVTVELGDTDKCPAGIGALASRSTAIGGSAVVAAARLVMDQAKENQNQSSAIEATVKYEAEAEAWGYGCYLAQISIDRETGDLDIENMRCVDDAGNLINPAMVEGQLHGGIAQGVGEATMEHIVYDGEGQLVTGSLMDYALPRASDMPPIELDHVCTPTDANLLGAKGVGEAGTIGTPAAIYNAVADALAPLGVTPPDMPFTANAIWTALQNASLETE